MGDGKEEEKKQQMNDGGEKVTFFSLKSSSPWELERTPAELSFSHPPLKFQLYKWDL